GVDISDFEYNFPKNYELLRIVSVFSWELPVVGVYGGKNEWNYYFGNYNSSKNFAIYRNHSDWYSSTNPCDFVMGKEIFSKKPYVPTEIVLGRDGRFSVFVYGEEGFVLSCENSEELTDPVKIDIGYAGKKNYDSSVHKFFFDCPVNL
uniref:Uncharacterized protein n=1 Tax=Megaselia scalaris TaxID=36166 RepID=T1GN73_MEGSC